MRSLRLYHQILRGVGTTHLNFEFHQQVSIDVLGRFTWGAGHMTSWPQNMLVACMKPILNDAHKKTPPGPRIEQLEKLLQIDNFRGVEAYIIRDILPIVLKRIDDKPNVAEVALKVGQNFLSRVSIQSFPRIIEVLFQEMNHKRR